MNSTNKTAVEQRVWRLHHPDNVDAHNERRNKKRKLKRATEKYQFKKYMLLGTKVNAARQDKQILRHHAKGRDVAAIVIWMNLPASYVASVIEKSKGTV